MHHLLIENRKARFDYELLDKFEAGISLLGFEVKALKNKQGSLQGAYVVIRDGEAFVTGMQVPPYQPKNTPEDYDPYRTRKLLLEKKEIAELAGKEAENGLTIVPISLYNKSGKIKIEVAVARGKKKFDKRASIKKRDVEREIGRRLKN